MRLIVKIKWWMFGEPACITRKRIRQDMAQMGYECAWTNWHFQARSKE